MSTQITTAFVEQYKSNVLHLAQQKGSRLRNAVRNEQVTGKAHWFERIGAAAAEKRTSRHSDTPRMDTPHSRRKVTMDDYDWADLIDNEDKVRLLISPQSEYALAGANAMGRAIDSAIIDAATGNAYDKDGTAVALPSAQKIAHGSANLNLAKVVQAKQILDAAEVDPDEERFMVCTADQIGALLSIEQFTSADYVTVKALAQGDINSFMGFTWIRSERLNNASGSDPRKVLAFAKSGMGLAIGADISTKISERADKNYATQVFLSMSIGATRIEDAKVVEISCNES